MKKWLVLTLSLIALVIATPTWADDRRDCLNIKDPDASIRGCSNIIAAGRQSRQSLAIIYDNRGYSYYRKRDYDRAIADFDQAIRLGPKLAAAYDARGYAYDGKGDHDRAIADFDQAIRLDPKLAVAYSDRGSAYDAKGDHDRAIADFDQAIRLDPKLAVAYSDRGVVYEAKGDYDRAMADFDRLIELLPDDPVGYVDRGATYNDKANYDLAIADYDKAIQLKPDFARAYNVRGVAYDDRGDHDRAIADYDKAIELKPDDAGSYSGRGLAYDAKGDHDRAIADYDRAIQLQPDYARAYNHRGAAYYAKGDHDHAIADYDKAIQLQPDYAEAYNNRGLVYEHSGDHDHAIADVDKAIQLTPDFGLAYLTRGEINDAKGELAKALVDFQEAARLIPESDLRKVHAIPASDLWKAHAQALAHVTEIEKKLAAAAAPRPAVQTPVVADAPVDLGRRVALVIGNGAYTSPIMPALPNPPHDAEAIGSALRSLGFDVDVVTDATKQTMEDALARLARKARAADVTLIFYAGHGLQDQGKNYIAPVDATLSDETDLRRRFVRLDDVLDDLAGAKGARILLLDACRNNGAVEALRAALPKGRSAGISRGLARIPEVEGQLVAFATQSDRVAADGDGADSPFTTALIAHLAEPGVELRTVLTRVRIDVAKATNNDQIPEVSDSLLGEIYLQPR